MREWQVVLGGQPTKAAIEKKIVISGKENTQICFLHHFVTIVATIMNGC